MENNPALPTKRFSIKRVVITILVLLLIAIMYFAFFRVGSQSSFQSGGGFLNCSQEIKGRWSIGLGGYSNLPISYNFYPFSQSEVTKYCRDSGIRIEYRAVLDILRRDDVNVTIENNNITDAWVRALGHKYIHDKDYLKRILPAYAHMKIDCIIIVHSPESTRFFIENGDIHDSHDDHRYLEIPESEFLSSLNNAPKEDVNNFWLGLH